MSVCLCFSLSLSLCLSLSLSPLSLSPSETFLKYLSIICHEISQKVIFLPSPLSLSLCLSLSVERLKLFLKKYTRIEKAQKKFTFVYAATKVVFGGPTLNDTNLQQKTKCMVSRKQNISYKSMDECIFRNENK